MITRVLNTMRRTLRHSGVNKPLRAIGVVQTGRWIYDRRLLTRGQHGAVVMGQQLQFKVTTTDEIRQIDGQFGEDAFLRKLMESIRPGDVFYDVGANIGMVTLLIGQHAKAMPTDDRSGLQGITIHSFEPEPRNADRLRENIALNNLPFVTVHEIGLGSQATTIPLYVDGETGRQTHSILEAQSTGRDAIEIRLRPADQVAGEAGIPTVMKIDVEGAEMEVLRGADRVLSEGLVRDLFIEVHPDRLATVGSDAGQLRDWLEARRYHLVWSADRIHELHQHYRRAG